MSLPIVFCFAVLIGTLLWSLCTLRTSRGDALGIPLVAVGSFTLIYVLQPLAAIRAGAIESFLTEKMLAKAILVPAIMLICLVGGWLRSPRVPAVQKISWRPHQLWNLGFGTALTGLSLYAIFIARSGGVFQAFGEAHGAALAFRDNTAYLYGSPMWILSGTAMMLCASGRMRLAGWRRTSTYIVVLVIFAQAVLTGSRGPLFTASSVIFVGYTLAVRRRIPLSRALVVLSCVGVGALLMLGFRGLLHLGGDRQELPGIMEALTVVIQLEEDAQSTSSTGNEFIFHASILETVDSTQKYDLGLNWIYMFTLHPIPRILWAEKPYRFETPGVHWEDILEVTGLAVLGGAVMHADNTPTAALSAMGRGAASGAAPGIVADLYKQFGLLSALAFYLMGKCLRRLYVAAASLHSPLATCSYIMLYSLSLNGFAQELYAVLEPFAYAMAPIVLFELLGIRRWRRLARPARFGRAGTLPQVSCSS